MAPAFGAVIATSQSGGPFARVPPASNTEWARGSKRRGRDRSSSVHLQHSFTVFQGECNSSEQKRYYTLSCKRDSIATRWTADVPKRSIYANVGSRQNA
jgi:hypothetical protein